MTKGWETFIQLSISTRTEEAIIHFEKMEGTLRYLKLIPALFQLISEPIDDKVWGQQPMFLRMEE